MTDDRGWRVDTTRPWDLLAVVGAGTLLLLVIAIFPSSSVRIILGLPFILFFPGYALVAALFPERHQAFEVAKGEDSDEKEEVSRGLDALERVALSFGLSIAVVPLLGLALNYTPFGMRLVPILVTVYAFIVVASVVAHLRRTRLPPGERFRITISVEPPAWGEYSRLDKVLTVALAVSVVVAGGALVYVLSTPRVGESFTEFYILGPTGKAEGYPTNVTPDSVSAIIVGVVNHEHAPLNYTVRATWIEIVNRTANGTAIEGSSTPAFTYRVELGDEEEDERWVNVTAPGNLGQYKLALVLETPTEPEYRRLHLWVDVTPTGATEGPRVPPPRG